ncbi:MFS transporter [Chloroflexus sp.]|uniref:MFS transporter n=1 Tax=Chloroflexus sp. TaxID=1904827 RepID=UPI00298EE488|nr:MFS transporter [Chloroflexus sp.]MDW8403155.1 MFS transporter [Chloroflexus sp.]
MTSQTGVAGATAAPTDHIATEPSSPSPLLPSEVRRGLIISIWEGAIANVHISITGAIGGSVFLSGFALLLGANNFQIGLLGALPFIGQLFQFLSAYLEARFANRRTIVLYSALAGRLVWAFLLCLPFTGWPPAWQLTIFFIALGFSYGLNGMAGNAWMSWMSDLVPPNRRGSYFGVRNTVAGISAMVSVYAAGLALDHFRARGAEAQGYAVIFGVAVLAAFGAALLIARQPEPPITPRPWNGVGSFLVDPLRDAAFGRFTALATAWAFVTGIAAPFFNAYGLTALQLDFSLLALTGVVTNAVALFFSPLVGWLMDRYGYRPVVTACVLGTVPLPLGWILSTPDNIVPLWLTSIFSGVFWPGVNQGLSNLLMERAPAEQRGAAMAIFSLLTGLGTLIASLAGGAVGQAMTGVTVAIGPLVVSGLATLFVLTMMGRIVMAGAFWRMLAR